MERIQRMLSIDICFTKKRDEVLLQVQSIKLTQLCSALTLQSPTVPCYLQLRHLNSSFIESIQRISLIDIRFPNTIHKNESIYKLTFYDDDGG